MPLLPDPCCWGYDVPDAPLPHGRGLFNADQMRAYGEACAAAERERCADVCDKEAADANSSKRKPFLTVPGKTLYEGMAGAAQNCAAAIRGA